MDASPEFTPPASSAGRKERVSDRINRSRRLNRSHRPSSSDEEPQSEASTDVISNKASGPLDRRDETPSTDVTPTKTSLFRRHRGSISMESPSHPHDESPVRPNQRQQNEQSASTVPCADTKSRSVIKSSRFADKYRIYKKQKDGAHTNQTADEKSTEDEDLPLSPTRPAHKKFMATNLSASITSPEKASRLVQSPTGKHQYHRLEVPEKIASPSKPNKSTFVGSPMTSFRRTSPATKKSVLSSRRAASLSPSLRYLSIPSLSSHDEKSPVPAIRKMTDPSKERGDFKEPTPPKTLPQSVPWPHLSSSASDESSNSKKNEFKGVPLPSSVRKALVKQSSVVFASSTPSDANKLSSPSIERPTSSSPVPGFTKQPRSNTSSPIPTQSAGAFSSIERSALETKSAMQNNSRSSSPCVGPRSNTSSAIPRNNDCVSRHKQPTRSSPPNPVPTTTTTKQSSPVATAACAKINTSTTNPSLSNPSHNNDAAVDDVKESLSPLEQARANLRKIKEPDQAATAPLTPFQQARARLEAGAAGSKNKDPKRSDVVKNIPSAEEDEDLKHLTHFQRVRAQMEKKAGTNASKPVVPVATSTCATARSFPTKKIIADSGTPTVEESESHPSTPRVSAVPDAQVAPSLEGESSAVGENVQETQEETPAPTVSAKKRWGQTMNKAERKAEEAQEGEKIGPPVSSREKWGQTLNNRFAQTEEKVEAALEKNPTPPASPKKKFGQTLNNRFVKTEEKKEEPVIPQTKKWGQPAGSHFVSSIQKNVDSTKFSGGGSSVPRVCIPEQKKPAFTSPKNKFAKNDDEPSSSKSANEPATTKPMSLVAQARAQLFESPKPKIKQKDEPEQLSAFEQARAVASANCLKNTKKSTPSEPKPLTPFEQARLNAEAMAEKNRKKVISPNRPRNKFDVKRQSLGSPEPRPATTLEMAYKDVIAESHSVEVVVRENEPSVEVNAIEEPSRVATPGNRDTMAGRFPATQSKKQPLPKMYFTGTPPQNHISTPADSITKTQRRAERVEIATPPPDLQGPSLASLNHNAKQEDADKSAEKWTKINKEPFQSPPLPPSSSWNQNKAAVSFDKVKTTTEEPSIVARWKKKVEENREQEQDISASTGKNVLQTKEDDTAVGAEDTELAETNNLQMETRSPPVGPVPSWAANLKEINQDGFEEELERCDTDIEVVDATETSMEKIEVQHLSADRLVIQPSSSPVNRVSRPWMKDLVSMSPKSFSDFAAPRMEKLRASPKVEPSVCGDGNNEEKKDDLSSVGNTASLTDLAVMSIHAVDFDNTVEGPIKVTLSSGDEDSIPSPEFGSALPSKVPQEFSEALNSSAKQKPYTKVAQSESVSSTQTKEEEGKLVFGEPSTYGEQGDESQKPPPNVSERAKALANWQGGRSASTKKKPTYTTHAKEILASGDNLVEALQGSDEASSVKKDAPKVRTVQDLADQMECWNVVPHSKKGTASNSNFDAVEWIDRDPDLEVLNVTEDQIPESSPKSQLSPSEAYADEMKDLKSWVGDNETVKHDTNDESASWEAFPSQAQVEEAVDPFSLDTSLTFSKATGENKVTFDPVWDTDGFEHDFFAGGPNPFAEPAEPFDRQFTDAFATTEPKGGNNPFHDKRGPTPDTLDAFWSSQSGSGMHHDSKRMNI